jgi:hypothetical protein
MTTQREPDSTVIADIPTGILAAGTRAGSSENWMTVSGALCQRRISRGTKVIAHHVLLSR